MPSIQEKNAQPTIDFIQSLTHTTGEWAGKQFSLIPWQTELITKLFGTLKKDGYRQYKTCYCCVGKKNGKTEAAAAIVLKLLIADGEQAAQVYSAAGDHEQASLVYTPARIMVDNNADLRRILKVLESRKRIVYRETNSFYSVLSSESFTKHGLNVHGVVIDELHAHPNRVLYDTLTQGAGDARRQPLTFIITTAGLYDTQSVGWQVHEYARQVKEGIIKDPTFLPIIYAADTEDDIEDPKTWLKANPSMGYILRKETIKDHLNQAKNDPLVMNNFLRFRLNRWVGQYSRYIPMEGWNRCKIPLGGLEGRTCWGGMDLSSTTDLTAFALWFPPDDDCRWHQVKVWFFIPADDLDNRAKKDGVPYREWVERGDIIATAGNVVDYKAITEVVKIAKMKYNIREIAYDSWGATKLAQELQDDEGMTMVPFGQGYKSMSPPTKEILRLILAGELAHGNNPILTWNVDNLVVAMDPAENVKPAKNKAKRRIDGIVAAIMALGRAIKKEGAKRSRYEDEGLTILENHLTNYKEEKEHVNR